MSVQTGQKQGPKKLFSQIRTNLVSIDSSRFQMAGSVIFLKSVLSGEKIAKIWQTERAKWCALFDRCSAADRPCVCGATERAMSATIAQFAEVRVA
ncbi:hypothetical protein L596_013974 [Steinernema carpocapsae]|uniref:Uncharacterized protein n=1 Tax=Steinernema carpocapsae TaxID=34508 RepID=A0A4U5N9U5_STECR|nr:hypothetical protein L596_013974 [Steinernema carpocapsae]